MATERDDLEEALEEFKASEEAWQENRDRYIADVKFARFGEQWPEYAINLRGKERPCLTFNKMATFIRQVVNDSRQNKPSITVHPVDSGGDPETAKVLSGMIRNIEVSSNADVAYDTAIDNSATGGFGFFRINTAYTSDDTFDRDIIIERIQNPLTIYPDEASTAADSSDWNKCFVSTMMTRDEFEQQYPGAELDDWTAMERDDLRGDWVSEEMIRVAEWWQRERVKKTILLMSNGSVMDVDSFEKNREWLMQLGIMPQQERDVQGFKVTQRIVTGSQVLDKIEWPGKYIPIVPVYGDEVIDENGARHFFGMIYQAKDAQRSYNYWRTSAIEKVALETKAPWIGPKGAFVSDYDKWATSNTMNHAYIEYDGPIPPSRQPFAGVPSGDMAMAAQATDDIKATIGLYDASLGARSNETSGRAIIARQREGDVSTFHYIDNMSRAIRHAGRILVDLIPHVYDGPRVVRTLKEDGTEETVQVNQEFDVGGMTRMYDIRTGKYDVTVKAGPSFTSRREEAAIQMTEMVRAFPPLMQIGGDLLVKNLDWPGADELAQRMQMASQQAQGQNPQAQQMQQNMQRMQQQFQSQAQQMAAQNQQLQQKLFEQNQQLQMLQLQLKDKSVENQLAAQKNQTDQQNAETQRIKVILDQQARAAQAAPQPFINQQIGQ